MNGPKQVLIIGWRNIAQAAGQNANTLARSYSLGTLPVQPQRVGNRVAMTPAQIDLIKRRTS